MRLLAQGRSKSQISEELVVAEGTTRRHVANIYEKFGVANRAEATRYALREGLLGLDETFPSEPSLLPHLSSSFSTTSRVFHLLESPEIMSKRKS